MPRKGRIDFPGALHHVIIRGINRTAVFKDIRDRRGFIQRLQAGLEKTGISCYAWALIPNHVHLLLRTGAKPLTKLMQSLLTGYALYFNRRHRRVGYLFQNRYKSILCDEEAYLLQLVRYIHLNPLRSGLVSDIRELNNFPWCGHSVLLGKRKAGWQDVDTILGRFGATAGKARRAYLEFVKKGITEGRRTDLIGGGLRRSVGGWEGLRELRKTRERWQGDERILGDNDFVHRVLRITEEQLTKKARRRAAGWTLLSLLNHVSALSQVRGRDIRYGKRDHPSSKARALFCWWAVSELGYKLTEVAVFLNITKQAVAHALRKGKVIAQKEVGRLP